MLKSYKGISHIIKILTENHNENYTSLVFRNGYKQKNRGVASISEYIFKH